MPIEPVFQTTATRGRRRAAPFVALTALVCLVLLAGTAWAATDEAADKPLPGERWITADHSKFEVLRQEFTSGPQVTAACLSCHTEAAAQFMKTIHWTWICPKAPPEARLGKAGFAINNFCIGQPSNEPRCTSCHAGYGYKDKYFDFTDQARVDCLVCHEQTGTYEKFPAGAGNPAAKPTVFPGNGKTYNPPDWNTVAQSVARPTRENCGTCHFFGGGGDGVKHGDLDSSMFEPDRALDVHMDAAGANFPCTRCHTTVVHKISGRCYKTPAADKPVSLVEDDQTTRITCVSCHTATPHKTEAKLNDHTDKVACQSCHIPTFARVKPTKMRWDWSTAGRRDSEGRPIREEGPLGRHKYDGQKGDFVWAKDVVPQYFWFNGSLEHITAVTKIDDSQAVMLNDIQGNRDDPNARIYPFKIHTGKTPYDSGNKTMVIPHLFGPKGSGAYWQDYDWDAAIRTGMAYNGLPYSGEYGFVETAYAFPTTHMVAPKENALQCGACHSNDSSRLANLGGFYMPGRDSYKALDIIGWLGALGALAGVSFHGLGRMVTRGRRRKKG